MRSLGALNMSIGTSLALEGDAIVELTSISTFMVNARTLIRNVIQSYGKDDQPDDETLYRNVKGDLIEIAKWLEANKGHRIIDFIVYFPSYKSLQSIFSKSVLITNKNSSDKRINELKLITKLGERLAKEYPKQITKTDSMFPSFAGKGVVITHHPVDLTLTNSSTRLKLLESYTGTIKPYTKWYTKLTGGDKLFFIPLNKLTIQVFGDRSTNFFSDKKALKETVIGLAEAKGWNSGISFSKVKSDIKSLPNGITREGLKLLF